MEKSEKFLFDGGNISGEEREQLRMVLEYGFAADLVGSTSLNLMCDDFQKKGFLSCDNPFAKIIPTGICEDGGSSLISGISATGHYIGVGSSYATFMGPMSFTAARLFCIAFQAKRGKDMAPVILINAHAGLKTGEDGPTHACPQTLSLWKRNSCRVLPQKISSIFRSLTFILSC